MFRPLIFSGVLALNSWGEPPASSDRPPAVQGHFYSSSSEELSLLVARYLKEAKTTPLEGLTALLVPHAGLEFSGAAAAKAYKGVPAKGRFDSVLIVGTGHHKAVAGAAIYPGAYAAGGFKVPYDAELAKALTEVSPLIVLDGSAHEREHSVEVQIPFLAKRLGAVKTVAMVMNTQDLEVTRAVGRAIAAVLRGRRTLLVASSDLSHYPSGAVADTVDRTTLEALSLLDPAYFWLTNRLLLNRGLPDLTVSYCGEGAVTAVMTAARELGANRARLLKRFNSGDVVSERDYRHVVGYAVLAFIKEPKNDLPRLAQANSVEQRELLSLARRSIESALRGEGAKPLELARNPRFNLPAAVTVTLLDKRGEVRGRSGSSQPEESLAEAVAKHAAASALREPNVKPLTFAELAETRISISRPSAANSSVFSAESFEEPRGP